MKVLCFLLSILLGSSGLVNATNILTTKHNLSSSGRGEVRAISEDKVCVFCHTPHNATPLTPLWNRTLNEGTSYNTYDSTTLNVILGGAGGWKPTGPSRLCLSCHDGTVGLGAVLSVSGGIQMTMELGTRPSMLGEDFSDDHPFSFSYNDALTDLELHPSPPSELTFYNGDMIHCSTCHDPHDDSFGMFLRLDNKFSALCMKCHNVYGWGTSAHATSAATESGGSNRPWPVNIRLAETGNERLTVAENGCENCHIPHNAKGPQRLMIFRDEEQNCLYACHNGYVSNPEKNIQAQFAKEYAHHPEQTTIGITPNAHDPLESADYLTGHVECDDCHDSHSVNNAVATAPDVSGRLINVSGKDSNGTAVNPASYEYEICFKCHGDSNTVASKITRYVDESDNLVDFDTANPSFHPVVGIGQNANVPSLPIHVPGTISLDPLMSESSYIYCSDCHSSDGTAKIGGPGPNGPHGSNYPAILREQYKMVGGVQEGYLEYALCYRCHDRDVILNDVSFKKNAANNGGHSGHLGVGGGTPCSVCHDPHGVAAVPLTGDHTHLINFDTTVVFPAGTNSYPLYTDGLSEFSGSCTLTCHGVTHDGSATYTY